MTLEEWVREYLYYGLDVGCGCCAADEDKNIRHLVNILDVYGFQVPESVEHRRCDCGRQELRDKFVVYEGAYIHYPKDCRLAAAPRRRAEELYA